jgi:hypothetical protein
MKKLGTRIDQYAKQSFKKLKETAEALEIEFNNDKNTNNSNRQREREEEERRRGLLREADDECTSFHTIIDTNDNSIDTNDNDNKQMINVEQNENEEQSIRDGVVVINCVIKDENLYSNDYEIVKKEREEMKLKIEELIEFERKFNELREEVLIDKKKREEEEEEEENDPKRVEVVVGGGGNDDNTNTTTNNVISDVQKLTEELNEAKEELARNKSKEIELKAIKNVTNTLRMQLAERDEKIAKLIDLEKGAVQNKEKMENEIMELAKALDVLRKMQKEANEKRDKVALGTQDLNESKRELEKKENEILQMKKTNEDLNMKYEKVSKDWLEVTTRATKEQKELIALKQSETINGEKIEKLEEHLLQTKLELDEYKHCRKERDDALAKLSKIREEIVDLKHEKSAYENNSEDLRLVNEARECAEKALVIESKKTMDLEVKLRKLMEQKHDDDYLNTSSPKNNAKKKKKKNNSSSSIKHSKHSSSRSSTSSSNDEDDDDEKIKPTTIVINEKKNTNVIMNGIGERANNNSSSNNYTHKDHLTIVSLKAEIESLKKQLKSLASEKDDKISVIDSDRAQLQRNLEEAKKTAAKLIKDKMESVQAEFTKAKESHAKELALLKEEIIELEEDRNEWKRKCSKAREETEVVRKRAREMLIEKEEELDRALRNGGGKGEGEQKRILNADETFLPTITKESCAVNENNDAPEQLNQQRQQQQQQQQSNDYLKNIVIQYISSTEYVLHERLVPVFAKLCAFSDVELANVIADRLKFRPRPKNAFQKLALTFSG